MVHTQLCFELNVTMKSTQSVGLSLHFRNNQRSHKTGQKL